MLTTCNKHEIIVWSVKLYNRSIMNQNGEFNDKTI